MRVLYISNGLAADYQCDMLFHGLKSIQEIEVFESSDLWYMYNDISEERKKNLYGKGFTLYGVIDKSLKKFEPNNIVQEKILSRWYDVLIYGQIARDDSFLDLARKSYAKNEIMMVDGRDHQYLSRKHFELATYFKRELTDKNARKGALPINFAIPETKVVRQIMPKQKDWGSLIPGKISTYIFDTEEAYYNDYQISAYGLTTKKAGWDCLRHYEILASGCIPYFPKIQKCPRFTMAKLPKDSIHRSNGLIEWKKMNARLLDEFNSFYLEWTARYLTTRALATYVLSYCKC